MKKVLAILSSVMLLLGMIPAVTVFGATVIRNIAVSDVVEPVVGESPSYTANVVGDGYTLAGTNYGNWKIGGIVWLRDGDAFTGSVMSDAEKFRPGHTYTVMIDLVTEGGYSFLFEHNNGNYAAVTINGQAATLHIDNCSTASYQVCYTFVCEQTAVSSVMLYDLEEPQGGKTPDTQITSAYPAYYVVESVAWTDIEGGAVNGSFETGVPYQVEIVVASAQYNGDDLSRFADDMTVYIDGTQLSYLDRVNVIDNKVVILYKFRNPAAAPEAEDYRFITQPTGAAVGVGDSHNANWRTNFIPQYFNIEYWDGAIWDQWDCINEPESGEGDYDFTNNVAENYRFRIVAYIGNDAVATSNEFIITWGTPAATVIDRAIVYVVEPVVGKTPRYECSIHTTGIVSDVEDDMYGECQENGVVWFCDGTPMLPTDTYEVGKAYTVRLGLLRADNSVVFATNPQPQILINNQTGYIQYGNANYISVEYNFPVMEGYTVTFVANGGSGTMHALEGVGGVCVIPECAFTPPSGKVFKSWKINGEDWWPGENYPMTEAITLTAQWKLASDRQQVTAMVASSEDIDTIPTLYGRRRIPQFTIIEGSPAYLNANVANLRWEKKVNGNWKNQMEGRFTPGEWRVSTQVRIDHDAATTHELGTPFTLTVNGEAWTVEAPFVYPTYSMAWVYSPVYVIEDDPNVQPPQPIEEVHIRLVGYTEGASVDGVTAVSDAGVNVKVVGFLEISGDLNALKPGDVKEATGVFSAQKTYAAALQITAKNGFDISWLLSDNVAVEQATTDVQERYDEGADSFEGIYILKAPAAANKATITSQPKTTYTKMGATAKATVQASGDGLKYTWYVKNAGASKYSKSSITSSTYSVKMSSTTKNRSLYCVVTDKYGKTVQSSTVVLREAVSITTQPATAYAKNGATAKVTVKASGDGLSYTWYVKNAGASKYTKSSITASSYSVKMSSTTKNRSLYCVVKDTYGKTVQSSTVVLREAVSITTQPATAYAKKGATAKVTVKASGDGLSYTW